jgi:hypothetical protein
VAIAVVLVVRAQCREFGSRNAVNSWEATSKACWCIIGKDITDKVSGGDRFNSIYRAQWMWIKSLQEGYLD